MKLTPFEIQQQQFKKRFRGFDVREVETFLEQMADAFESLQRENESLCEEINKLEHETPWFFGAGAFLLVVRSNHPHFALLPSRYAGPAEMKRQGVAHGTPGVSSVQ